MGRRGVRCDDADIVEVEADDELVRGSRVGG